MSKMELNLFSSLCPKEFTMIEPNDFILSRFSVSNPFRLLHADRNMVTIISINNFFMAVVIYQFGQYRWL